MPILCRHAWRREAGGLTFEFFASSMALFGGDSGPKARQSLSVDAPTAHFYFSSSSVSDDRPNGFDALFCLGSSLVLRVLTAMSDVCKKH